MIHDNNHTNAYCSAVNVQTFETVEHNNSISKHTLMHKKTIIIIIPMLKRKLSVFVVLGVRLTKYQQIHPDIAPAV